MGGDTAAGNWRHLDQNRLLGEGSLGRHSLYQLSCERETDISSNLCKSMSNLGLFLEKFQKILSQYFLQICQYDHMFLILKGEVPSLNIFTLP